MPKGKGTYGSKRGRPKKDSLTELEKKILDTSGDSIFYGVSEKKLAEARKKILKKLAKNKSKSKRFRR